MFLNCPLRSTSVVSFPESESGGKNPGKAVNPTQLEWYDFSCPPKAMTGHRSGPMMIASFLESIYFRQGTPKAMPVTAVDAYIAAAKELDKEIEDFTPSDEGYVTLESYLNALASDHKYIKGSVKWTKDLRVLKWMIQKCKCAIVETCLMEAFTANPQSLDIKSFGSSSKALRKDYTKVWIAFGYDSNGLLVLNSLGVNWGKLGFARIAWSLLEGNVVVGDDNTQTKCFIKAAAFEGCFN